MDWRLESTWSDNYASPATERSAATAMRRVDGAGSPGRLVLTGTDSVNLSRLALHAMQRGWQVAFPAGRSDVERWARPHYSLKAILDLDGVSSMEDGQLSDRDGAWDVAMSTSGTTGQARSYGFTFDQISSMSGLYRDLYRLSPASHIVTAMPAAHNFAFVAGVCAAAGTGARMVFARRHDGVARWLKQQSRLGRVVALASPVLLDHDGLDLIDHPDLLIDSGAAPLSRPYVLRLRRRGVDIREGYGTTETLSLTHYDTECSAESAGTVGYPVAEVTCRIDNDHRVFIRSPFTGQPLDDTLRPHAPIRQDWIPTGDLGSLDDAGRLRIVGRVGDNRIGGRWPRDILDGIGDLLGSRTATVHCLPDRIEIRTLAAVPHHQRTAIGERVATMTGMPSRSVSMTAAGQRLTYSMKLPGTAQAHSTTNGEERNDA